MAGEEIDPERLLTAARDAAAAGFLVCEGVGGFLVPLSPRYLIRDFARDLRLPVAIAASPGLGTINHTLLTIESVRDAGLDPVAVVLTPWPASPAAMEESNRATVARLGDIRVETLAEVDPSAPEGWPALLI
jgi:dethiobiotin synthetase